MLKFVLKPHKLLEAFVICRLTDFIGRIRYGRNGRQNGRQNVSGSQAGGQERGGKASGSIEKRGGSGYDGFNGNEYIYAEARGESDEGKSAVGQVVYARANGRTPEGGKVTWWGTGIKGGITAASQFSWLDNRDSVEYRNALNPGEHGAWEKCYRIAEMTLAGGGLANIKNDRGHTADSYAANAPYWATADKYITKIGDHRFYTQHNLSVDGAQAFGGSQAQAGGFDLTAAVRYNRRRPYSDAQWRMIQKGVGTDPDGIPGENTAAAIRGWQSAHGLDPDGKCDPLTYDAISKAGAAPASSAGTVSKAEAPKEPVAGGGTSVSDDWKADILANGEISEEELYEDSETLYSMGRAAGKGNSVKTLQALLNRALAPLHLGEAKADSRMVSSRLDVDGMWGVSTAAHMMYFLAGLGYDLKHCGFVSKFKVEYTPEIWKALREKNPSVNDQKIRNSAVADTLADIPGTDHKIRKSGLEEFLSMREACRNDGYGELGINSSYRAMSSHGMPASMRNYSGQLKLFALRVAGIEGSDCAIPTSDVSKGGNHQSGSALDFDVSAGSGQFYWLSSNAHNYHFKNCEPEPWHWDYYG